MSDTWTEDDDEMREMWSNTIVGAFTRLGFALDECKHAFMLGWHRVAERRQTPDE